MTSNAEKDINDLLVKAFQCWCALEDKHPDDVAEFKFHIHALQNMIAWRVARRADPDEWGVFLSETQRGQSDGNAGVQIHSRDGG